jgi:short-subunit dehydrogenase
MDLKLAGKTALITGASKGIGGAAAEMLAAEGCHLVLVARTAGDLARAKESIARKANVSIETVPVDLSVSASVTRLARELGLRIHQHVPGVLHADESAPCRGHHQRDRQRSADA